jgi:hypothetical protein
VAAKVLAKPHAVNTGDALVALPQAMPTVRVNPNPPLLVRPFAAWRR